MESFGLLCIEKDYYNDALWHNVRFQLSYLSPNMCACSHLGYKLEGVAFYANTNPPLSLSLSVHK